MIGKIVRLFFYKSIYKNITIFNILMWLIFSVVDIILNQVTYFSKNSTYTPLDVYHQGTCTLALKTLKKTPSRFTA